MLPGICLSWKCVKRKLLRALFRTKKYCDGYVFFPNINGRTCRPVHHFAIRRYFCHLLFFRNSICGLRNACSEIWFIFEIFWSARRWYPFETPNQPNRQPSPRPSPPPPPFYLQISRRDYVQALYETITLDPRVVHAYRTDVRQLLLRTDNTGAPPAPRATLQALGASSEAQHRSPAGARLPPYAPPQLSAPLFSPHYAGAPTEEGNGCAAERPAAGNCYGDGDDMSTNECVLRDSFLRRVSFSSGYGKGGGVGGGG